MRVTNLVLRFEDWARNYGLEVSSVCDGICQADSLDVSLVAQGNHLDMSLNPYKYDYERVNELLVALNTQWLTPHAFVLQPDGLWCNGELQKQYTSTYPREGNNRAPLVVHNNYLLRDMCNMFMMEELMAWAKSKRVEIIQQQSETNGRYAIFWSDRCALFFDRVEGWLHMNVTEEDCSEANDVLSSLYDEALVPYPYTYKNGWLCVGREPDSPEKFHFNVELGRPLNRPRKPTVYVAMEAIFDCL